MLGVDPLGYEQLAGAVAEHVHVLTASNAQTASLRHEALTRKLATSQAQIASVKRAPSRALAATQGAVATMLYNRPHSQTATQAQAAQLVKLVGRRLILAQPQAAVRTAALSRTLAAIQASSYGPQLPPTPLTVRLEEEEILSFPTAAWTILAWAESIGFVYQKNKGLTKTQKPVGWGTTELKKLGARYNVAPFADPINSMIIRDADTATSAHFVAIGICVPSNGERSGYVARIETVAGTNLKVTLERWINGAKAVLAETTLELAYFGAISTEKEAPFALTLVGGVLRLWLAKPSATPTVLLSATDTTFTSGYNTMESLGGWQIAQEHAATMDGWITLAGVPSTGRLLQTTQTQVAVLAPRTIARFLAVAQGQGASLARAITRALSATQAQLASVARAVTHSLLSSQAQSPSLMRAPRRILSTTQLQAPTITGSGVRILVAGQGQVPAVARSVARSLSVSQGQVSLRILEVVRVLELSQGQSASISQTRALTLAVAQSEAAVVSRTVVRSLAVTQSQTLTFNRTVKHTLNTAQTQTIEATSSSTGGPTTTAVTLTVAQSQVAILLGVIERGATEAPSTITPTTNIGVINVSLGVVEKGRRRHLGLQAGPVRIVAPEEGFSGPS